MQIEYEVFHPNYILGVYNLTFLQSVSSHRCIFLLTTGTFFPKYLVTVDFNVHNSRF